MRIRTPHLEITGITDVWINRISHWKREFDRDDWRKVAGGPGFQEHNPNVLAIFKTATDFHAFIQEYLDREFPDIETCHGDHPRMYRAWISGSTLNIVQRKVVKKNGFWEFDGE